MSVRHVVTAAILAAVLGGTGYYWNTQSSSPADTSAQLAANLNSLSPAAGSEAPHEATAEDPKVAQVGSEAILKSDVVQLYDNLKQRAGGNLPPMNDIFWMLVDQIASSRLVIQQAQADKLQDSPAVQASMKMAQEQILQDAFIQSALKGVDDDAALKPRYEALVATYKGQTEMKASHILVADEAKAAELIAKIKAGADFATVAKENSEDSGSKETGGDLGFFTKDAMVPEFANAAAALQVGQMTDAPVKSQFGWHIIKVTDSRPRVAPTFEQVRSQLLSDAQQEKVRATIEALRAKAEVKKFEVAGIPAPQAAAPAAGEPAKGEEAPKPAADAPKADAAAPAEHHDAAPAAPAEKHPEAAPAAPAAH